MAESCGACRKQVKSHEQGIQCDLCQYWYHTNKCADVTKGLMEFLNSEDGQKSNVHWYCRACENTSKKLFEQMVLIEKRLSSFEKEVQKLGEKVDHLISKQPEQHHLKKKYRNWVKRLTAYFLNNLYKPLLYQVLGKLPVNWKKGIAESAT